MLFSPHPAPPRWQRGIASFHQPGCCPKVFQFASSAALCWTEVKDEKRRRTAALKDASTAERRGLQRAFSAWFTQLAWLLLFSATWVGTLPLEAQTNTNKPAVITNQPSALVQDVERLKPVTFDLDQFAPLRERTFLGEPLWKYAASLIYILLAFYASKLIDFIARVWLKRIASRSTVGLDEVLVDLLHGPIKVVVFVVLLNIGLNIFDWSPRMRLYLSKASF